MQRLQFIGNLTKDAREYQNFVGFTVAVNETRKGEKVTTYIECTHNIKEGSSLPQHLKKGTKVYCNGIPGVGEYEGKPYLKCSVFDLELCGQAQNQAEAPAPAPTPAPAAPTATMPTSDGDLPF